MQFQVRNSLVLTFTGSLADFCNGFGVFASTLESNKGLSIFLPDATDLTVLGGGWPYFVRNFTATRCDKVAFGTYRMRHSCFLEEIVAVKIY
jgi:hypothetical protein